MTPAARIQMILDLTLPQSVKDDEDNVIEILPPIIALTPAEIVALLEPPCP